MAVIELRRAAVLARLAGYGKPPRVGVWLAKGAAWSAIGAVLAVLAVPLLALLDAVKH